MPHRPEPQHPEKLFCASINISVSSYGGSNDVTLNLLPLNVDEIPQSAQNYIRKTYGQTVLQDLLNTYPQYPQGSPTLDITIDAPTFIIYVKGPDNWFFMEDGTKPPMHPPKGQNYGPEFGPVVNFIGQNNKIESYGVFAKYMKPNGAFKFDIDVSIFQTDGNNTTHETKLFIDPAIKNDG